MKTSQPHFWRHFLLAISSLVIFTGCDVTPEENGNAAGGGGGGQAPDPVVVDFPIAYVERPIPFDEDAMFVPHDALDPAAFRPGARLLFKTRASVPAVSIDITSRAFSMDPDDPNFDPDFTPLYDVKDVSASPDGAKLIFAMRAPEDPNAGDNDQPTWNIWEYDRDFDELRRVIVSDVSAEKGQDVSPAYLPDGRIVFSSTRQSRAKAILLDESKPQFSAIVEAGDDEEAFVLHVMDEEGRDIDQITYNQSHDLYPTVMSSGEIVFLRWDNAARRNRLSLYSVNPDGSNPSLLYGYNSQNTATGDTEGVFVKPLEMPDGRIMVNLRPRVADKLGGDIVMINTLDYIDNTQPVNANPGGTGPAQESASVLPVNSDGSISAHGYFSSAYPLNDGSNRFLVSWSSCRVLGFALGIYVEANGMEDPTNPEQLYALINDLGEYVNEDGVVSDVAIFRPRSELNNYPCTQNTVRLPQIPEADTAYGLWVYDTVISTQSPVVLAENGMMFTDAIVMEPRVPQAHIPKIDSRTTNPNVFDYENLLPENLGVLHIRNVYELDGVDTAPNGYAALADPAQTTASERPARFLRLTKAVSMPSDDVYDFDNSAFGIGSGNQMKDILGYVPIEPDGSAMFKVPADTAFAISILDDKGKRRSARHQNWLTVRPGEVRHCNGCHTQNSDMPHGRLDAEPAPSNLGALSVSHFPNTVVLDAFGTPQPSPEVGETMAQYWTRVNGPRTPSVHINFDDDWTDPALRAKDASFSYNYSGLTSGVKPTSEGCADAWNALCRVVINYETHIQPLWDVSRQVIDPVDAMTVLADNTCTTCHASTDAMGTQMLPAGNRQLDLSNTMSDTRNEYFTSYAELFLADQAQELNGNGILQNEQVQLLVDGVPQIEAEDVNGIATNVDENIVVQDIQLIINGVPQYQVEGTDVINGTVSFSDIQTQIFDNQTNTAQRCQNCHTGASAAQGSGGLNLDAQFAYAELTDPADVRVVPFDSANSLLVQRLQGTIAPRMPTTGGPLSNAMIQMVVSWIDFGAPETGTGSLPCGVDCPDILPGPIDDPNVILDGNGNPIPYIVPEYTLILDQDGNRVPFMVDSGRSFGALMRANGAIGSSAFFDVFEQGGGTVDHSSFLSPAELKLIAEWLDIGGQYYNNPFDAPAN